MASSLIGNGALDVAGAAAFTALIVQQTKFLIEYVAKPTNKNHDAAIRLYADVVAIVVVILSEVVTGILNVHNGHDWMNAVVQGFSVGLAAIGGYHLINGLDAQTPRGITLGQQLDQAMRQDSQRTPLELLATLTPLLASQTAALIPGQPLPGQTTSAIETPPARAYGPNAVTAANGSSPVAPAPPAPPAVQPIATMPQTSAPAVAEGPSSDVSGPAPATLPVIAIPPDTNGAVNDPRQAAAILAHALQEQWDAKRAGTPEQSQQQGSAPGMPGA